MLQVAESAPVHKAAVNAADDARDYALLRRAICDRDDGAWVAVLERYSRLVRSWVRQHPSLAEHPGDEDARVNRAFERFWRAVTPDRFADFANLASLLQYLKLCAGTVGLDEARAAGRRPAVSLDQVLEDGDLPYLRAADDPERDVVEHEGAQGVWSVVERELRTESDRVLAHLSFVAGLTPAAIHAQYSDVFPSVMDIYRRKAHLLERLRRSPELLALVSGGAARD